MTPHRYHVADKYTVKNRRNLVICNPKPDLYNINAYTKFVENTLIFNHVMVQTHVDFHTDGRTHGPT